MAIINATKGQSLIVASAVANTDTLVASWALGGFTWIRRFSVWSSVETGVADNRVGIDVRFGSSFPQTVAEFEARPESAVRSDSATPSAIPVWAMESVAGANPTWYVAALDIPLNRLIRSHQNVISIGVENSSGVAVLIAVALDFLDIESLRALPGPVVSSLS